MIRIADDYFAIKAALERLEAERPHVYAADLVEVTVGGVEITGLTPDGDEDLEQLTDLYIASALAGGFC